MRKLFLSVLAIIVLVGTIFAPSRAWSFSPINEVCFLLDYSAEGGIFTTLRTALVENQEKALYNFGINETFNVCSTSINHDGVSSVITANEKPGVFSFCSWPSCLEVVVVNPIHGITFGRSGANIRYC